MPIYEYECKSCRLRFSQLVMNTAAASGVKCTACGSGELTRLISSVMLMKTEASRLADLNTSAVQNESYYRDNRTIGLWAKKRARELGADLGPAFDEKIEKARSGKILEEL